MRLKLSCVFSGGQRASAHPAAYPRYLIPQECPLGVNGLLEPQFPLVNDEYETCGGARTRCQKILKYVTANSSPNNVVQISARKDLMFTRSPSENVENGADRSDSLESLLSESFWWRFYNMINEAWMLLQSCTASSWAAIKAKARARHWPRSGWIGKHCHCHCICHTHRHSVSIVWLRGVNRLIRLL